LWETLTNASAQALEGLDDFPLVEMEISRGADGRTRHFIGA
jgi:hypothetical protein